METNMIGKYLFAVICFFLAQVRGIELEEAINDGLNKVEAEYERGNLRIEEATSEVENRNNLIRTSTETSLAKLQNLQESAENNLKSTARAMEETATELNRSPNAFRCIANAEKNAINHIAALTVKYKTDLERLERTKLTNIETAARPLENSAAALTVRYSRAVGQITICKTTLCVENAVNSCSVWVDKLFADIDRVLSQVITAYNNYERDSTVLTDNTSIQINSTEDVGLRQIQKCISE